MPDPKPISQDPTLQRLDEQISWYDRKSDWHKLMFRVLKIVTIVTAASIPVLTAVSISSPGRETLTGAMGATIVVIEGIQQLYQYQTNWLLYRSTCESLKHEKYLFLATAGPYGAATNPHALLAERIESLVSQEHAKWASTQQTTENRTSSDQSTH